MKTTEETIKKVRYHISALEEKINQQKPITNERDETHLSLLKETLNRLTK